MWLPFTLFFLCILQLAVCAEDFYQVCILLYAALGDFTARETEGLKANANSLSQLLGIDKQASERDIKRAYRTLSKKYHPDKNP